MGWDLRPGCTYLGYVHFFLNKIFFFGIEVSWSMLRRPSAPQWISKWQNIFGTFQIECENFWTFWKFLIFHDFSDFFENFPKIFDFFMIFVIFMIFHDFHDFFMIFHDFHDFFMKNRKFSKSPKYFSLYFSVWSRFCGLEIPETKSSGDSSLISFFLTDCTYSRRTSKSCSHVY